MLRFKVSAPSSLRLFGEHSQKFDTNVIRVPTDLRTMLKFEKTFNSVCTLSIRCPRGHRTLYSVSLENLLKFYNKCIKDIESLNEQVIKATKNTYKTKRQNIIIHAFYYLLIYITYKEQTKITSFHIELSSQFYIDNEFACLASIIVCLVVCFFHWSCVQKGVDNLFTVANINNANIQSYARHYDEISSTSELFNIYTSIYGSIIEHENTRFNHALSCTPSMTILLVDSKQYLDNITQQAIELMNTIPEVIHSITNSINTITKRVYDTFKRLADIHQDKSLDTESRTNLIFAQHKVLENCIITNQNLLKALNISCPHLDYICSIAAKYGMCGKYTDIGYGRFVHIWCLQHVDGPCTHVKLLANELIWKGYKVKEMKFAHEGVKIEPF